MDIGQYITELLNDHDVVGVPGFGSFFKTNSPSYFDPETNTFFPGHQHIGFRDEVENDAVLVDHIVSSRNISENSARYFATNFGGEINRKLNETGVADAGSLGRFTRNDERFQFKPAYFDSDEANFGLQPVEDLVKLVSAAAETKPYSGAAVNLNSPAPAIKQPLVAHEPAVPDLAEAISEDETNEPDEVLSRRSNKWIIILTTLVVIAAAAAVIQYYYPQINSYFNHLDKPKPAPKISPAPKQATESDSLSFADSVMANAKKADLQVEKARDTAEISVKTKTLPNPASRTTVEIIGAALANQKDADSYVKNLRSAGFDARVVKRTKKWILVSLGSFKDRSSAEKELPRFKKIQPGAYLKELKITQ
ncbi:hypothetical protein GS399_10330 [Pedobacter sp. HMF7647]|uniref:SPOR domain-containing protein n=1 Tax=Hufsiella arboris TaxID=2695275 RepID=A0A7K1Y9U1_9SPHI|nr:SPOR domain-containing protein [Hufsiella arboris]MXV51366.1 hypothetical protein [Hufsiella arboris]